MPIERSTPDLLCIVALPPGGFSQTRYLCKRVRTQCPEVRIVVVRPGVPGDTDKSNQRLLDAGATTVATSVTEARTQAIQLLLPALIWPVEPDNRTEATKSAGALA